MAYRDPYAEQYGQNQQYGNNFNPYAPQQDAHPGYAQHPEHSYSQDPVLGYGDNGAGYRDNPRPQRDLDNTSRFGDPQRQATMRSFLTGDDENTRPGRRDVVPPLPLSRGKDIDQTSGFDHGEFTATPGKESGFGYRDNQKNLWTKGGRGRCIGRFCCCTIMVALFLFASIFLTFLLWIRPPAISFQDVGSLNDNSVTVQTDGITVNLGVNISVHNPNYFAVNFKEIKAEIYYPINNTAIGSGSSKNLVFKANAPTNFTFPFAINYKTSLDPNNLILVDLATKCGVLGAKSDITVNYKITLGIRILMVTISPVVSNTFRFTCPLDASDLDDLLKGVGLSGLLGSI